MIKYNNVDQKMINGRIKSSREDLGFPPNGLVSYNEALKLLEEELPDDIAIDFTWKYIFELVSDIDRGLRRDIEGTLFMALIPEYESQFWISELEQRVNYYETQPPIELKMGTLILRRARSTFLRY